MGKFKVGDKVVPISKSVMGSLESSAEWEQAKGIEQKFLYVNSFEDGYILCHHRQVDYSSGDYFAESDLQPLEPKPTKNQRIEALEKRVGELELIVEGLRERKVIEPSTDIGVEDNPFDWVDYPLDEEKTPNQLRAEIIEKAKGFVENEKGDFGTYPVMDKESPFPWYCKAEFIVNEQKQTVVVLMRGVPSNTIYSKGKAKCNPSDVFNEHIGKAVALGRALGLDVSEFEGAVQPNEIVVGMKVSNTYNDGIDEITNIESEKYFVNGSISFWNERSLKELKSIKIINDTNAIYGEVK